MSIEPEDHGLREEYHRLLARRRLRLANDRSDLRIEDLIEKMRANVDGVEHDDAYYDELRAYVLAPPRDRRDGLLQTVIDGISDDIEAILADSPWQPDLAVYAGEFPHGSFNAQARLVPQGALLLINTGLFMLLHQALKIITLGVNFQSGSPDDVGGDSYPTPYSDDETTGLLADAVLAYVLFGDSMIAAPLPPLAGGRLFVHAVLLHSCELFAVAHEYGHVLEGHLSQSQTGHPVGSPPAGSFVQKSRRDELAADLVGAALVVKSMESELPAEDELESADPYTVRLRASLAVSGPLLFFTLGELVDQVRARVAGLPSHEPSDTSTHPPHPERYAHVRGYIESVANFDLSIADGYRDLLLGRIDPVVERARQLTAGSSR